jgi:N-acetylmuramoyl-L-alanine amidase
MTLLEGLLWLTLNVYHEARSEPQIGQIAVAHVTLNRATSRNISIKEVVTQPYQFSWTIKESYVPKNMPAFFQCLQSAYIALSDHDFTAGATHFHQQDINPDWSSQLTYLDQYGSHKFYR